MGTLAVTWPVLRTSFINKSLTFKNIHTYPIKSNIPLLTVRISLIMSMLKVAYFHLYLRTVEKEELTRLCEEAEGWIEPLKVTGAGQF